ncbi:FAD-binding oxidoreductase [Sphingobium sp. DC-2]|uniref:FAD-binding oxidoreductase n=1 Tax=Sphingobium sp. DC-2 TaxID=1303256 RepID=UPI0004C326FF|nr:FAD-binding oxidoreductase [Sphingobium sp. DC-2]
MALPLPPQVSAADFKQALEQFAQAVGSQWVFTSEEDVMLYRDAYSPLWDEPDELIPSAAVAPSTVEEVQAVVRIANRFKVPLYTISTGMNLGYGGSSPNLRGSVIVDLKRMNRIIEVDDKRHFAIVEPGVSYFDLYRYIQERKLKVWLDIPDPGWGSPIGNALDHGLGYTLQAYRDHFGAHSGMEVVLPNGEVMRTGMGAMPGSKTFAEYRYGYGPYVDGLFGQANFGIVTKMGFWLMPEPEAYISGLISVKRRADFAPLVDIVNYLENTGTATTPQYSSPLLGKMMDPRVQKVAWDLSVPDEQLDQLAADLGVPAWTVELQFYGNRDVVRAAWQASQARILAAIPGSSAKLINEFSFPFTEDQKKNLLRKSAFGIPALDVFALGARNERSPVPADGHLGFTTMIAKSAEAVFEAQKMFIEAAKGFNIPSVVTRFNPPMAWQPRSFMMLGIFMLSRDDPKKNRETRELYGHYLLEAAKAGYGEYRAPAFFQEQIARTYSFNNNALLRFAETMKDAVDPNGILSPGRGGIWPARYRKAK